MLSYSRLSRAFSVEAGSRVAIKDQATMRQVAPMTLNLQKQRGIASHVFSGMMWHYPNAPVHSSLSSRIALRLPLSGSEELRSKYSLFGSDRYIRLGRILEDLDALAADIAYKHTGHSPIVVTASMDRMRLFSELKVDHELQFEGAVVHVGRSSMRVSMSVSKISEYNPPVHIASSTFLMVSRARGQDVAQPVHPLSSFSTDTDKSEFESSSGKRQKSDSTAWSAEEISLIHDLHHQKKLNPDSFIWHREARDDKALLMHSQNRNVYGRMFGGHLMASAYELAWLLAYKLAKRHPSPTFIDDIEFIRPVDIGSILRLEAQVAYTQGNNAVVDVRARVINPVTEASIVTNTFHFGFDLHGDYRGVVPETYNDMVEYIEGFDR